MQAGRRKKIHLSSITGVIMNTPKLSQNVGFSWIMSVLYAILGGMTELWNKYTYVCGSCDALVESTTKLSNFFQDPICSCAENSLTLLSVVDATIGNSTTEKDNPIMETTLTTEYNPNLLVTYKKIEDGETSYVTDKVNDIEYSLDQSRRNYKMLSEKQNEWYKKESQLRTLLEENFADSNEQELLAEIAEIFDVPLTKEIEVTAWVRVDLTVEVDLTSGDFDNVEDFISSNLTVDSYGSEINVTNYEVERVEEGAY